MNGLVFFVFFRCYRQGCTVANQSSWILHGAPAHGVKAGEMLEVDGWGRLIKCWKDSRIPSNIPEAPLLCHNDEPERIRFQPKKLINWKSQDAVCSAVLRTRIGLLEFFCIFFYLLSVASQSGHTSVFLIICFALTIHLISVMWLWTVWHSGARLQNHPSTQIK